MMKTRVVAGILALAITANASARSFVSAHVTTIRVDQNGWGMVFFDVTASGAAPSCVHPDYANALAFDVNTAGGKAILAVASSAKAQGSTLHVNGAGSCVIYGNAWVEDWSYGLQQ